VREFPIFSRTCASNWRAPRSSCTEYRQYCLLAAQLDRHSKFTHLRSALENVPSTFSAVTVAERYVAGGRLVAGPCRIWKLKRPSEPTDAGMICGE
jgi:hypothetical protein